MGEIVTNHDFTHGELDPKLFARSDLQFYNKSAKTIQNLIVQPGGSVKSRFGSSLFAIPTLALPTRMFGWESSNKNFIIIVGSGSIYMQNVDIVSDSNTISNTLINPSTVKGISHQNKFYLSDGQNQPMVIEEDFSTSTLTFKNPPTYEYDINYDDTVFNLDTVKITSPDAAFDANLTIKTMGSFGGFTADYVGGWFESLGPSTSDGIGRGQITQFISSTSVSIRIDSEFAAIDPVPTSGPLGEFKGSVSNLTQTAYNTTNGWPACISIFQDRLILAGGSSINQTIFMSAIGDFRDFSPGDGLDSDAISFTIGSEEGGNIQNIVSSKSLQIFTNKSEYATSLWSNNVLTPSNISISLQTGNGSTELQPVTLDNRTFYIKQGGKSVMSFSSNESSTGYISSDESIMSSHLINNPTDMCAYTDNDLFPTNILLSVVDNQLIIYQTMIDQNISAWSKTSRAMTNKDVYNVVSIDKRVFILSYYGIEEIDWNINLDAYSEVDNISGSTAEQTITLPSNSYSQTDVSVVAWPGEPYVPMYIGEMSCDGSGNVTGVFPIDSKYYFGYKFKQELETLPAHLMTQQGDTLYTKKKINKIYIHYYESLSFKVNGKSVPMKYLSTSDQSLPTLTSATFQSGIYTSPNIKLGWSRTVNVIIEQDAPLSMNILGVSVELTV